MGKRRDVYREALITELSRRLPRDQAEAAVAMGLFRIDRSLRQSLRCGARTKGTGRPCQAPAMKNGRCKLHGGVVGKKTPEGLARIGAASKKRWEAYRRMKSEGGLT
jgi:hypothetical protein